MRRAVCLLFTMTLFAGVLGGCVSNDEPVPLGPLTSGEAEGQARDAVARAVGEDVVLVAAFGVAAADPTALVLPDTYPGLQALTSRLARAPSAAPGDGALAAWAYIYETPDGRLMGAVVSGTATAGGDDSVLPEATADQVWVRAEPLDRTELGLLRANGTLSAAPAVDSKAALKAALDIAVWGDTARQPGAFIIFLMGAAADGTAEWRLVAATGGDGFLLRVDGASGAVKGTADAWPERPHHGIDTESDGGTRLPGEETSFPFTVPDRGASALIVRPMRTATWPLAPEAQLIMPDGSATVLEIEAKHTLPAPVPGQWSLRFAWSAPDVWRTIGVEYCAEPLPFLFAGEPATCTFDE